MEEDGQTEVKRNGRTEMKEERPDGDE